MTEQGALGVERGRDPTSISTTGSNFTEFLDVLLELGPKPSERTVDAGVERSLDVLCDDLTELVGVEDRDEQDASSPDWWNIEVERPSTLLALPTFGVTFSSTSTFGEVVKFPPE